METKANYLMIGGFVLGVLAFAFIFVFWISNFASGGKRYKIVFESSVAGLTSGSSVSFNGIKVGEVQSFALDPEDGRKVQVLIGVDDMTPVRKDSRARIQSFGLTGGSGIQITPGTPQSPLLEATDEDPVPTIEAGHGGGGLFDAAPAALNSASAFIQRLDDLVAKNEDAVTSTMSNVDQFTTMLKDQNEKISQTIKELEEASKSFNALAGKLDTNVDGLSQQAKQGLQNFNATMEEAHSAAISLNRILENFEKSPTGFLLRGSRPSNGSSPSPPSSSSGFGPGPSHP